jgi:hypothetical protein
MTLTEEQIEQINSLIADCVEYEEEHRDAGDAYAHMLGESWHSEHDNRLREALAEHGLELGAVDLDQLAEEVILWAEMTPAHIYDSSPKAGQILLDSYPIGEIELFLTAEELGFSEITPDLIDQMNRSCDAYFRQYMGAELFAYVSSDRIWDAQISIEQIRLLIEQLAERIAA